MNVVPASVPVVNRVAVFRPDNTVEDSSRSATNDMTVETNTLSFLSVMRTFVARPTIAMRPVMVTRCLSEKTAFVIPCESFTASGDFVLRITVDGHLSSPRSDSFFDVNIAGDLPVNAAFDANLPVVLSGCLFYGACYDRLLTGVFKSFSNGSYFSLPNRLHFHCGFNGTLLLFLLLLDFVLPTSYRGRLLSFFYTNLPCGWFLDSFLNCLSSSLGARDLVGLLSLLSLGASFGGSLLAALPFRFIS
jgi:hypothetical protein